MAFGLTPAFATDPNTASTGVQATVGPSVSLTATGSPSFGSLLADNIASDSQSVSIASTSNVPIDVGVQAGAFSSTGTGNMPISALQWSNPVTESAAVGLTSDSVNAITGMAVPTPAGDGNPGTPVAQNINLNMKVPFGTLANTYNNIVTWTATPTIE